MPFFIVFDRGQKRTSDPPELELMMVVTHRVVLGTGLKLSASTGGALNC